MYAVLVLSLGLALSACGGGDAGGSAGVGGEGGAGGQGGGVPKNRCPIITRNIVSPLTQSVGNLVNVETTAVDAEGDEIEVAVLSDCGDVTDSVQIADGVTGESSTTVRCAEVQSCRIVVVVSDDGFDEDGCNGRTPDAASLSPVNCQMPPP